MTPYTGTLCIISCCEIKYKFLSDLELQIALEETNHCRLGLWQWSDSDSNSSLVTCYGLLSSPPWNVQTLTPHPSPPSGDVISAKFNLSAACSLQRLQFGSGKNSEILKRVWNFLILISRLSSSEPLAEMISAFLDYRVVPCHQHSSDLGLASQVKISWSKKVKDFITLHERPRKKTDE